MKLERNKFSIETGNCNCKKFEKNNVTIDLNVLYARRFSKQNPKIEKQVIILMISIGKRREARSNGRQHHVALKELSALLKGITFKHHDNFYFLNCPNSFVTEKKT